MKPFLIFFLQTCFISSSLFAEVTSLIDSKSINPFNIQTQLKKALKSKNIELVTPDKAVHGAFNILINTINYKPEEVGHVFHLTRKGMTDYRRMINYSKTKLEWAEMNETQKARYFETIAYQLAEQVSIEADLKSGKKLQQGYFKNFRQVLSEAKKTDMPSQALSVPNARAPSLKVDFVDVIPSKKTVKSKPKKEAKVKIKALSLEKEDLVQIPTFRKVQKSQLKEALEKNQDNIDYQALQDRFNRLEKQMHTYKPEFRSSILTEQALIYVQIGDTDEALTLLDKAVELNPDDKTAKSFRKKLLPPKPSILEKFRTFNKSKGISASFSTKVEYDSNMVLEQKDPVSPSNKDDLIYSSTLGLNKSWNKQHRSNYYVYMDFHNENSNFDIMAHTLSHSWAKKVQKNLVLVLPVSTSYFALDRSSLLWNVDFSPMLFWTLNDVWSTHAQIGYKNSSYYDVNNQGLEAKQTKLILGGKRAINPEKTHFLKITGSLLNENTDDDTLAYDQSAIQFGYDALYNTKFISYANASIGYQYRSYKEATAVGAQKRKDDRFTFKFNVGKDFFDTQSINMGVTLLDNQSNITTSKYDKYKTALTWKIKL